MTKEKTQKKESKVGGPTKLTPEIIVKAKSYLATCKDDTHFTDKGSISYTDVKLPSVAGLAKHLGIHKDTIYSWCKEEAELYDKELVKKISVIVKEVDSEQEIRLLNGGLGGIYTPKIAGMILGKHGYSEKTSTDITTKGEAVTTTPEILAKLDAIEQQLKKEMSDA